jgi:hypothetical protein
MANGGIIGPVNDPTISDLNQTFTASGTFNMPNSGPAPGQADYLVVAGGGGGGPMSAGAGGGGGGGGFSIQLWLVLEEMQQKVEIQEF